MRFDFLEQKDTIAMIADRKQEAIEFVKQYPDVEERRLVFLKESNEESYKKNFRDIDVFKHLLNYLQFSQKDYRASLKDRIFTFDFTHVGENIYEFYIRDDKQLTKWKYNYPALGVKSEISDWEEIIKYTCDSVVTDTFNMKKVGFYKKFIFREYLPSGKKHVFNSINDSLFFKGHFRAILQDNNVFLINQHHGGIYYLGDSAIHKTGQIDIQNYTRKLFGKHLFIEDRDNNRLIFFSNVERIDKTVPFPQIKVILKETEFNKMFKNILE